MLAVAAGVLLLLSSCAAGDGDDATSPVDRQVVQVIADNTMTFTSLSEWVSFSDHVVVFTVVSEQESDINWVAGQREEGVIDRSVDITIDSVVRSSPGAPELPDELTMNTSGAFVKDGGDTIINFVMDGPRIEVGGTYLAPMVLFGDSARRWGPMTPSSVFPMSDGKVVPDGRNTVEVDALNGLSSDEVALLLDSTPPDPSASRSTSDRAIERFSTALAARRDAQKPG